MTNTEYKSGRLFPSQSVFKNQINFGQQKPESRSSSLFPSLIFPCAGNNFMYSTNFTKKPSFHERRIQNFYSNISEQDNNLYGKLVFPITLHNSAIFEGPIKNSLTQSRNSFYNERFRKPISFDPNTCLLNFKEPFNKQEKQEKQENHVYNNEKQKNFIEKNKEQIENGFQRNENTMQIDNKINFKDNPENEKEKNVDLNTTMINNNNNIGTKFFTNHNYGYKCSCSKTQCNRKYCECYNSGNYCIDCNCKNCTNKPPENTYSNKRPKENVAKMKKSKEICTCTKSGCNKNYCECFKSGNKCTSLCRCIGCENNEDNTKTKKNNNDYERCPANSIYIIKNKIFIDNIDIQKFDDNDYFKFYEYYENKINKLSKKKRKRDDNKNPEEDNEQKETINEPNGYFNDSLFDKNGKVVLRHINIIHS